MSTDKFETYHGVRVVPGWGKEIERAQVRTHTTVNGVAVLRIRHSTSPSQSASEPCQECAVLPGQLHVMGCDFEQCPNCGGEFLYCPCKNEENM
jgi:hypothetical protein